MEYFHGRFKNKKYFEGWYFKIAAAERQEEGVLALIPGIQMDEEGRRSAFIQVITSDGAYFVPYDFNDFKISRKDFLLRIGDNVFGRQGIKADIQTADFLLKGKVRFGPLTPVEYPVMGPFRFLPFMECNHGVLSMGHSVSGSFLFNTEILSFQDAEGYIEMDWGSSFPESYLWVQAGSREKDCTFMASVASVPVFGRVIKGCICVVRLNGREYRLATYLGVKVRAFEEKRLHLKQGDMELFVECLKAQGSIDHGLRAPSFGDMGRIIHENAAARVLCRFKRAGQVTEFECRYAGWEYEGKRKNRRVSQNDMKSF